MLDLSTSYLQALLWSAALWLALPLTVSLCSGREASVSYTHLTLPTILLV